MLVNLNEFWEAQAPVASPAPFIDVIQSVAGVSRSGCCHRVGISSSTSMHRRELGMGVMIRESNRLVVLAASKCIPNGVQGWEAEALALLFGLNAVHRLEVPNLLVKLWSTSFIRSLHLRSIRVKRLYCPQVLLTDDYPTNSNM